VNLESLGFSAAALGCASGQEVATVRNAAEIRLERGVVHVVDHLENPEPLLSQAELPLDRDADLRSYFQAQIRNASKDPAAAGARFVPADVGGAAQHCRALLASLDTFLTGSQRLAQLLFFAMRKDRRISPGSLAVFRYTAGNYPGRPFLALLKLDPSVMLVQQVRTVSGGVVVSLKPIEDVLPGTRERLQKAALVQQPPQSGDPDLLLLDRQTEEVAEFFARGFLQAEPLLDARERTKRLHLGLITAYNEVKHLLTAEEAADFLLHIEALLRTEEVDLDSWIPNLGLPEEAEGKVSEKIDQQLAGERQFPLDTQFAREQLVQKLRFRGDFGVRLEVSADHYHDVVREVSERDGRTHLVLEVPNFRLVKKWA
jgi:hypothetical protein